MMNWSAASTSSAPTSGARPGCGLREQPLPPARAPRAAPASGRQRVDRLPRLGRRDQRGLVARRQAAAEVARAPERRPRVVAARRLDAIDRPPASAAAVERERASPHRAAQPQGRKPAARRHSSMPWSPSRSCSTAARAARSTGASCGRKWTAAAASGAPRGRREQAVADVDGVLPVRHEHALLERRRRSSRSARRGSARSPGGTRSGARPARRRCVRRSSAAERATRRRAAQLSRQWLSISVRPSGAGSAAISRPW